jgi:predicted ArsR family transcriptional regulator
MATDASPTPAPAVGRTAVLESLRSSGSAQSAADIAQRLGLHPNTVRGHLELLVHLGYATRTAEDRTERGRPKILYQAVSADLGVTEAYRGLATALAAELAALGATDQETADRAGEKWASALAQQGRLAPQRDEESAIEHVASLFSDMGFQVATEPMGDRIYLQQCPYREIVARYPSVCDLHLGLMRAAFAQAGGRVEVDRLDVDVRPGLCVAALRPSTAPSPRNKESE